MSRSDRLFRGCIRIQFLNSSEDQDLSRKVAVSGSLLAAERKGHLEQRFVYMCSSIN